MYKLPRFNNANEFKHCANYYAARKHNNVSCDERIVKFIFYFSKHLKKHDRAFDSL